MKHQIYLDNGSTSFPKPPCVAEAVYEFMSRQGVNINRGTYGKAYSAEEMVYETRCLVSELFHGEGPKQVVFTKNVTESLNVVLKGFLKPGDHVLTSSMEHNAVMRPLNQLSARGVEFSRIPCTKEGKLLTEELEQYLRPDTKAIVMTHASNVCGTIMPVAEVGRFCRARGLKFFLDSAQTAGVIPIDMEDMCIDALCFTGHKGLLGPQGTGGIVFKKGLETEIEPLLSGGTGSISHTELVPEFLPDRFEPGTMNLPGIAGLRAALLWLRERGIEANRIHEDKLTAGFLKGLIPLVQDGLLKIAGLQTASGDRTAVVSVQPLMTDPAEAAFQLDEKYGIMTRVGLHCAPAAHKTLGTFPTGTIRFSFGWASSEEEADAALAAMEEICRGV